MDQKMLTFPSYEEFKKYLCQYEKQTTSHFITLKQEKGFSQSEWKGKRLHWRDDLDQKVCVPYVLMGVLLLGCHQGRDKNVGQKERYKERVAEKMKNTNGKFRQKFLAQPTKKLDCPAVIKVKKVASFPDFKEQLECSNWSKRKIVLEIGHIVKEGKPIKVVHEFITKFPSCDAHKYHAQGEFAGMREPVDPVVRKKVADLVRGGMLNVSDIQKAVRSFVVTELFANESPPSTMRRRYHPTERDIVNISYSVRKKLQEALTKKCQPKEKDLWDTMAELHQTFPNDRISLKDRDAAVSIQQDEQRNEKHSKGGNIIHFCHQTKNQERLLNLYGSLVVIDVAYKSTNFHPELVFLYVRTNVDFQVVGQFLLGSSKEEYLKENLMVFREWNPGWNPEFIVMDVYPETAEVIQTVFPDSQLFMSEYHVERVWRNRLSQLQPGMERAAMGKILVLIFKAAKAMTAEQYQDALNALEELPCWTSLSPEQRVLPPQEQWVTAFRPEKLSFLLSPMNGFEKLLELLRTDHFKDHSIQRLGDLVHTCVSTVVPEFYQRYVERNIRASSIYGKYNESLPPYLMDRPRDMVTHIGARYPVSQHLIDNVVQLENGSFTVLGGKSSSQHIVVDLGNEAVHPSCNCPDWLQHRLPCRHFLAVFHHFVKENPWEQLSSLYTRNPIFSLDLECIAQHVSSQSADVSRNFRTSEVDPVCADAKEGVQQITLAVNSGSDIHAYNTLMETSEALDADAHQLLVNEISTSLAETTYVVITEAKGEADDPNLVLTTLESSQSNSGDSAQSGEGSVEPLTQDMQIDKSHTPTESQLEDALCARRLECDLQLKRLTQLTSAISDKSALDRVMNHIEQAILEASQTSTCSD
ncbi:uncharacterized protein [Diadema antillarum]|uniref:uncharacterized protein n=1 Tax=Diadema antillarum TaxID=105358 RepID=UPI003A84C361